MKLLIFAYILAIFTGYYLYNASTNAIVCPESHIKDGKCKRIITNCVHGDSLDKVTCEKFESSNYTEKEVINNSTTTIGK